MRVGGRRRAVHVRRSAVARSGRWPEKPVRLLVPFPPGGGIEIQARPSPRPSGESGPDFIIDNRTGASRLIATQLAVEAPADGNTILSASRAW